MTESRLRYKGSLCYAMAMDKPKVTPKDFFLWAGAMVSLYISVFSFVALIFDYINYTFPDPLQYFPANPYSGSISYEMASLIVMFPIFLILMRVINNDIASDPSRRDIWIRKWALYLTLFIAAVALAADLITLIMYFLNGEITVRFIAKIFVVFAVAGAGFLHFVADLRGYWEQNRRQARSVGIATGALIVITVVAGFFIIGTPWQARLYRFDEQKGAYLQNIQYQIVSCWQQKEELPITLTDLFDPISNNILPRDPQTGEQYTYSITGAYSFKLCATFNAETPATLADAANRPIKVPAVGLEGSKLAQNETWYHPAGEFCFNRGIDPERYPPFSKTIIKTQ